MQNPWLMSVLGWELIFFITMNVFWIALYISFRKRERGVSLPKSHQLVSIVIPVYNKGRYIAKTIDSVLSLDYSPKEIIVVNDGSTDNSLEACREYERKGLIRLVSYSRNKGKAHALNAGIAKAKGNYVLTVDGDSFLDSESLSCMIRHFDDEGIGAVAGVIRVRKGSGLLNRFQMLEYIQQAFQRLTQGLFNAVMVLPGPLSLYRKSAIIDAGGFESDTMVEDWDMTMKIHKRGYKVVSERKAFVETVAPRKVGDWWRQRIRWSRGGIKIARKHMNVLTRSRNKALTRIMFPLHIMWLVVPFIVIPTMIMVLLPSQIALGNVAADFGLLLSMFGEWLFAGASLSIVALYKVLDQMFVDFMDFKTFGTLRLLGYLSGIAFLWFTYTAIKAIEKDFPPRYFISALLMPIYWMLLNGVYVHSVIQELAKGKKIRW